jgi:2,3-bisphosphoglycerate-dependent phosphoglycerate mutase
MSTDIIFETHSLSEDNEAGVATGWLPGRLSSRGREYAAALGRRRRGDGLAAVFSSDLGRALETAAIASRIRMCRSLPIGGFGNATTALSTEHRPQRSTHAGLPYLDRPYPNGESWREATDRVGRFLDDVALRWDGAKILLIGHVATRLGLDRFLLENDLAELLSSEFAWQEGWEYRLQDPDPNASIA